MEQPRDYIDFQSFLKDVGAFPGKGKYAHIEDTNTDNVLTNLRRFMGIHTPQEKQLMEVQGIAKAAWHERLKHDMNAVDFGKGITPAVPATPGSPGAPGNLDEILSGLRGARAPSMASSDMTGLSMPAPTMPLSLGNPTVRQYNIPNMPQDVRTLLGPDVTPGVDNLRTPFGRPGVPEMVDLPPITQPMPPPMPAAGFDQSPAGLTQAMTPSPEAMLYNHRVPVLPTAPTAGTPDMLGTMALTPELKTMLQGYRGTPAEFHALMSGLKIAEPTPKDEVGNVDPAHDIINKKTGALIRAGTPKDETAPEIVKLQKRLATLDPGSDEAKALQGRINHLGTEGGPEFLKLQRALEQEAPGSDKAQGIIDRMAVLTNIPPRNVDTEYRVAHAMFNKPFTELTDRPVTAQERKALAKEKYLFPGATTERQAVDHVIFNRQKELIDQKVIVAPQGVLVPPEKATNYILRKDMAEKGLMSQAPPGITAGQAARGGYVEISDKQREQLAHVEKSGTNVQLIFEMADKIITATNPLSAGKQWLTLKAGAATKMDPDAALFESTKEALANSLSKAFGEERGVLTNRDVERWVKALPTFGDTVAIKNMKKTIFNQIYKEAVVAQRRSIAGDNIEQQHVHIRKLLERTDQMEASPAAPPAASGAKDFSKLTDQQLLDIAAGKK